MIHVDRRKYLYIAPVKIESPDQFVPMYVASMTTTPINDMYTYSFSLYTTQEIYHSSNQRAMTPLLFHQSGYVRVKDNMAQIKESLMNMYDKPYPKQYYTPIPLSNVRPNIQPDYLPGATVLANTFLGSTNSVHSVGNYINYPGFVGAITNVSTRSIRGTLYSRNSDIIAKGTNVLNIKPIVLTIVKAKHIPLIRVCSGLGMSYTIPVPDIKFLQLKTSLLAATEEAVINRVKTGLRDFFIQNETGFEMAEESTMRKYIFGEYHVPTGEEILEKAKALASGKARLAPIEL